MSFIKKIGLVCFIVFCCAGCRSAGEKLVESAAAPRIINIINFIRQTDYRVENADSLLYETVCEQVKLVNKYDLPATFLLQYDALINPLYQDLLKSKLNDHSEIIIPFPTRISNPCLRVVRVTLKVIANSLSEGSLSPGISFFSSIYCWRNSAISRLRRL